MGTARIKRKNQDTNVIVFTKESDKESSSDDDIERKESPHSENIKIDEDDIQRPDFSDSSADSFFSRDSNYILEEYHLYTELDVIEEDKE